MKRPIKRKLLTGGLIVAGAAANVLLVWLIVGLFLPYCQPLLSYIFSAVRPYPAVTVSYTNEKGDSVAVDAALIKKYDDGTYIVKTDTLFPPWIHVLNDGYAICHMDSMFEESLCDSSVVGTWNHGGDSLRFSGEDGFFAQFAVAEEKGILYRLLRNTGPDGDDGDYLYRLVKDGETCYYVSCDCWVYFDFNTRQSFAFDSEAQALDWCKRNGVALGQWHDRSDQLEEYTVVRKE